MTSNMVNPIINHPHCYGFLLGVGYTAARDDVYHALQSWLVNGMVLLSCFSRTTILKKQNEKNMDSQHL